MPTSSALQIVGVSNSASAASSSAVGRFIVWRPWCSKAASLPAIPVVPRSHTLSFPRPRSRWRHAFVRQLLDRGLVLRQVREAHTAQHVRGFAELDILVRHDLDAVAPRIAKVEKRSGQSLDACIGQCFASGLFTIDDESKMTSIVGGLCAALLERDELVSKIDERHVIAFASNLEMKQPAIENQRRFDVTDLQRDMIETDDTRFCFRHGAAPASG